MGRKIPAKKHRGVKDPLVQQARVLARVKNKINQPPKDPDEQPIPKSLSRLFGLEGERRGGAGHQRKQSGGGAGARSAATRSGAARQPHSVSRLRRLPGESARSFSHRITSAVRALHQDPHTLQYPVETEEEEPEREHRRRKRKAAAGAGAQPERETRAQRRRHKRQLKLLNAAQEVAAERGGEAVYERVAFGDTAHAPPALSLPRSKRGVSASMPAGARPGLLLARQLAGGGAGAAEERRLAVVAAYRALKATRAAAAAPRPR